MRIIRTTLYPHPSVRQPPMTTVMRDEDLAVSIAEFKAGYASSEGAFVIYDEFVMPGSPSIIEASRAALARAHPQDESNMAILYFFAAQILGMLSPRGVYGAPDPAPLSTEQVAYTLNELRRHPAYTRGKTVVILSNTRTTVTLSNGQVTPPPSGGAPMSG